MGVKGGQDTRHKDAELGKMAAFEEEMLGKKKTSEGPDEWVLHLDAERDVQQKKYN